MYDIHAHILPGVDDGPQDWDGTLLMLNKAAADGIKGIVASPHVSPGLFVVSKDKVLRLVAELNERPDKPAIEVYPGNELTICSESVDGLKVGRYGSINGGNYVMLELPPQFSPRSIYDVVFAVGSMGFIPIIAHPERNPRAAGEMKVMFELARLGCLMQLTAGSIVGQFGAPVMKVAHDMLTRNLAHVIASDAHDPEYRPPVMSEAFVVASRLIGEEAARLLVTNNPRMIINNESVDVDPPVEKQKSFFTGLWPFGRGE